jgi:hypothetical protein
MPQTTFTQSPVHTATLLGYKNESYIADLVMPRVRVPAQEFNWDYRSIQNLLVAPENEVSRTGRVRQLQFNAEQRSSYTKDYGYEVPVPQTDIDRSADQKAANQTVYDPLDAAAEGSAEILRLRREVRVAGMVADTNNHASNEAVSGTDQWSDPASNPKDQILDILESMLVRANTLVLSSVGARHLRNNPTIVESVKATGAGVNARGQVTLEAVRELLELDAIYVGRNVQAIAAFNDFDATAGQARRIWGNYAALLHLNPMVRSTTGSPFVTWGMTADYDTLAMMGYDQDIGLKGGWILRAGEQLRELVTAPIAGCLISNIYDEPANIDISTAGAFASGSSSAYTGV